MKIRNPSDLGAGLLVAAIAAAFLAAGHALPRGSASEMGPGWFPLHVAWLSLAIGLCLILRSFRRQGDPQPRLHMRPLVAVVSAVIVFAIGIGQFGLLLVAPMTIVIASFAVNQIHLKARLTAAFFITIAAAGVFVGILGLNIPLLPN